MGARSRSARQLNCAWRRLFHVVRKVLRRGDSAWAARLRYDWCMSLGVPGINAASLCSY